MIKRKDLCRHLSKLNAFDTDTAYSKIADSILELARKGKLTPKEPLLEEMLFQFLNRKYTQSSDDRQKEMGLQYMTAETHDLATEIAQFIRSLTEVEK